MVSRFFIGVFGIILSLILIKYRKQVGDFTGSIGWMESLLGRGGTYSGLALLGIIGIILSIMYMTGSLEGVIQGTFGRIF